MQLIGEIKGRKYYAYLLRGTEKLPTLPFHGKPFVLLVHLGNGTLKAAALEDMVHFLLQSNVRYVICVGDGADRLEKEFDNAIARESWDAKRGETILTTSYRTASVEEVVFDLVNTAFPQRSQPRSVLMLFLGEDGVAEDYIVALKQAATST